MGSCPASERAKRVPVLPCALGAGDYIQDCPVRTEDRNRENQSFSEESLIKAISSGMVGIAA